jgi:pantoate--beta-alanine ligase
MIQVVKSVSEWKEILAGLKDKQLTVGFVPTMGALHEGHISLAKASKENCDVTVVSIFVNPTQFNDQGDLKKYPKTFDTDYKMVDEVGVDYIFYPEYSEIYNDNYRFKVSETEFSNILCGAHRPGHFDGVLTVVMKLLNIIDADSAYFGEKDFQQLTLIRQMVEAYFLDTKIVGCPIVREADGLAMSSRNRLLSPDAREKAALLNKELKSNRDLELIALNLEEAGFKVEYIEEHYGRRFIAATIDNVRLIDNVEL